MGNIILESSKEGVKEEQNITLANKLQIFEGSVIHTFS